MTLKLSIRVLWSLALGLALASTAGAQVGSSVDHKARVQAWRQLAQPAGGLGGGVQPEVVDGRPAKAGRWPFMVSLIDKWYLKPYNAHFCGGTLLDSLNVLTAAHCVHGVVAANMQVLVGTHSLVSGGRRVDVSSITIHPNFLRDTRNAGNIMQNDVAVLRLKTPVTDIRSVRIASSVAEEESYSVVGDPLLVMGWGALTFDTAGPKVLYQAVLPKNDTATCNALALYSGNLSDVNLCAGSLDRASTGACTGDSGGPLISRGPDGQALQVGVVSGGPAVCGSLPGYFARVGALADWIKAQQAQP